MQTPDQYTSQAIYGPQMYRYTKQGGCHEKHVLTWRISLLKEPYAHQSIINQLFHLLTGYEPGYVLPH
jgi:hypothetical protein